jgi:hypothetical protein
MKTTLTPLAAGFTALLAIPAHAGILAFLCFAVGFTALLSAEYGRRLAPLSVRQAARATREPLRLAA